eukprot:g4572.t1
MVRSQSFLTVLTEIRNISDNVRIDRFKPNAVVFCVHWLMVALAIIVRAARVAILVPDVSSWSPNKTHPCETVYARGRAGEDLQECHTLEHHRSIH